jgi:hypothetical protein
VHGVYGVLDVACLLQKVLQTLIPNFLQRVCNELQMRSEFVAAVLQTGCRRIICITIALSATFLLCCRNVTVYMNFVADKLQKIPGGVLQIMAACCR